MEKFVYLFSELDDVESRLGGDWEAVRGLLGGKGANLADMTRLGVPVPPGFTVTSRACMAFLEADAWPEGLWDQELEAVRRLEEETGRGFGDPSNPLLVSARSGARFSMPGMMDTVLNVGLNDAIAETMAERTGDGRFVFDLYRRLVHMFGSVVMNVPDEVFEAVIAARRRTAGVASDAELREEDWRAVTERFQEIFRTYTREPFPQDPYEQLRRTTEAVFRSWKGRRAVDYRRAAGIDEGLGTAVNVQTMVYGNTGEGSATGVAMSRNATTGANEMEGDFLLNAQGEDVVAGIRTTRPLAELDEIMPEVAGELRRIARELENHYRNMQDMEFTVEQGKLWILQTRDGKRTPQAEVKIAVDMVQEGRISRSEAVARVKPDQVDSFLHPQLDPEALKGATPVARGLNVSPGAAVGVAALDPDTAERWAEAGRSVIMVRPETKPDDVHGMLAAEGILTSRGGRTSHAALVARQFGKPAVVGATELEIDLEQRRITTEDGTVIKEGEWIALDGNRGNVFLGELATVPADLSNPELRTLLAWADDIRRLGVRANADYPADAERAREYGAEGIGLCRTEHMFFESERLAMVQAMIMATSPTEREEALAGLLPMQRDDFEGLFRAMDGQPVVIRLLDPPLHEFLPTRIDLSTELADLKMRLRDLSALAEIDDVLDRIAEKQRVLDRVEELEEANPMLGTRGVRLGILVPQITLMQVRAIFEAACRCVKDGVDARPEIMIPLVSHVEELRIQRSLLEEEARTVMDEAGVEVPYMFGTMIEVPRAALTAGEMAGLAEFFSFGTNDLTQTVFGISRDDAESGFLVEYMGRHILPSNPFATLDRKGVGRLMSIAVEDGRAARPGLQVGICGEHGGDPRTIRFCHQCGLDYVSCSPFRVPVARLAAAHAALADETTETTPAERRPVTVHESG
ncbi:MAG: pyruvate, phosphate dikinase [Gemmatimonadota bacterium]